jgi:hypothetical protein
MVIIRPLVPAEIPGVWTSTAGFEVKLVRRVENPA